MVTLEIILEDHPVEQARIYAINCHRSTNHMYDKNVPYEVHLGLTAQVANEFIHLLKPIKGFTVEDVLSACWCHDLIEDCRQTYNDIKEHTNDRVADIVYAVTNEKGRNRRERGNDKYYLGIRTTPYASFVKLCDRIANIRYSRMTQNAGKMKMYRMEFPDFAANVGGSKYPEMIMAVHDTLYQL